MEKVWGKSRDRTSLGGLAEFPKKTVAGDEVDSMLVILRESKLERFLLASTFRLFHSDRFIGQRSAVI